MFIIYGPIVFGADDTTIHPHEQRIKKVAEFKVLHFLSTSFQARILDWTIFLYEARKKSLLICPRAPSPLSPLSSPPSNNDDYVKLELKLKKKIMSSHHCTYNLSTLAFLPEQGL